MQRAQRLSNPISDHIIVHPYYAHLLKDLILCYTSLVVQRHLLYLNCLIIPESPELCSHPSLTCVPSFPPCNRPRASLALVSDATGQYDEIFILSPTHSCTISFGAASCSLMTSPYRCPCLVSILPFCIGIACSLARSMLDLSLDTYLHHRSQLPCTCRVVV